jgi:hypothetical protein
VSNKSGERTYPATRKKINNQLSFFFSKLNNKKGEQPFAFSLSHLANGNQTSQITCQVVHLIMRGGLLEKKGNRRTKRQTRPKGE